MAIVTTEGERLYLNSWEYNMARALTVMAELIKERGGRCKPEHYAMVTNRTNYNKALELSGKIKLHERNIKNYSNPELINKLQAVLEKERAEYEQEKAAADNERPIRVNYTSYIRFILDGYIYYFQIDNNPFFPALASKTPVNNGKYSRDAVLGEFEKKLAFDQMILSSASDQEINEVACLILDTLVNSNKSPIYRDGKKRRVPNVYNGGYHYETIYRPERFATIDF